MQTNVLNAGALALMLWAAFPATGTAQGLQLKPGWVYAIAFADNGNSPQPGNNSTAPNGPAGKSVALYKVMGAADQNWYRVRMIARTPQGAFVPVPNAPEVWVNLNYAMWVQEVMR